MSRRRKSGDLRATGAPAGRGSVTGDKARSGSLPRSQTPLHNTPDPLWQRVYVAACGLVALCCAAVTGSLALAGWQGRDSRFEDPLALVGMVGITVLLTCLGLCAVLPAKLRDHPRFGPGFGIVLFSAVVTVFFTMGVACLVNPEAMLVQSGRGPRTEGQARVSGAILLAVVAVLVTAVSRAVTSRNRYARQD